MLHRAQLGSGQRSVLDWQLRKVGDMALAYGGLEEQVLELHRVAQDAEGASQHLDRGLDEDVIHVGRVLDPAPPPSTRYVALELMLQSVALEPVHRAGQGH